MLKPWGDRQAGIAGVQLQSPGLMVGAHMVGVEPDPLLELVDCCGVKSAHLTVGGAYMTAME